MLIENGVLATYLHTLKTAAEMGVAPTGQRQPRHRQQPRRHHLQPVPRGRRPQRRRNSTAWPGTACSSPRSWACTRWTRCPGDLSVGASGVRIRGGELAESVDRMTFAGNLRDFLTRIVALGDDLRWYGSSAGLSLLLEDISLGGA